MKKFVVCDYDCDFTFPNFSMGSAERRIRSLAKTISEYPGFQVYITGPSWLSEHIPNAIHYQKRLSPDTIDEFVSLYGKMDYLFAGHEYFDKPDIISSFKRASKKLISYQGNLYKYDGPLYDGDDIVLFCYCDEMMRLYKECRPKQLLAYHSGVDEQVILNETPDDYMVRMGRLDGDKSPHYAILAAKRLGIPLYVLGEPLYDMEYYKKYESLFSDPIVRRLGILTGQDKMNILSNARCGIYTTGSDYIEASGGVLSEMLRSGLPIAGISRRTGTAVLEAVNQEYTGKITIVKGMNEEEIIDSICENVMYCSTLDRKKIFLESNRRYDPRSLFEEMVRKIGT